MAGFAHPGALGGGEVLALLGAGVRVARTDVERAAGRRVSGRGSLRIRPIWGSSGCARLGNMWGVAAWGAGGRVALWRCGGLRGLVRCHYLLPFEMGDVPLNTRHVIRPCVEQTRNGGILRANERGD